MPDGEPTDKEDEAKVGILRRYGIKKRRRMIADSRVSFRKYLLKLSLVLGSFFFDFLLIPSFFQAYGMLDAAFVIPIVAVLCVAGGLELALLSRIR